MAKDTMPRKETGLFKRKDSNIWQWNITVPVDLEHLYPAKKIRLSLGTADDAEAKVKAASLRAHWVAEFKRQQQALKPQKVERVTPEIAAFLAQQALHDTLSQDENRRSDPVEQEILLRWMRGVGATIADLTPDPLGGMPDALADMLTALHVEQEDEAGKALARGKLKKALPGMQYVARQHGIVFDEDTPGAIEGLRVFLKAIKQATEAKVERDKGKVVATPPAPEMPNPRRLRDVLGPFLASKERKPDTHTKYETALQEFEQQTGNPPLAEITRAQGVAFKAWLLSTDLSSSTARDRLTAIKSLLKFAFRDLEWLHRHPWDGLDIEERVENKRVPWTPAQVRALFDLPLFTKYELPKPTVRNGADAAYWIPLLGLYTGARIGELCQLQVSDVVERHGIACISINAEGEGSTLKTEASTREIPIHSELLRLGFLDYVEVIRRSSEGSLWPKLKLREGKPGGYFSGYFGDLRQTASEEVPDFHSFRHTVRSKMARAKVPEPLQDRITGHEAKGSTGVKVYTHYTEVDLQQAIETVVYPELSLPRVFVPTPQTL